MATGILDSYFTLGLYMIWTVLFMLIALGAARWVRRSRPTPTKLSTYESGLETSGETWVRFRISYYLYALTFMIFDIEAVFLYPWATVLRRLGPFGLAEAGIFVGVLLLGLAYAWREGALEWK